MRRKKSAHVPSLFVGSNLTLRQDILRHERRLVSADVPIRIDGERRRGLDSLVNRLRASREIFGFWEGHEFTHPTFQFDEATGERHRGMRDILYVLPDDYTGWRQALWFFQGHETLRDERPADVYWANPDAVLRAALVSYGDLTRPVAGEQNRDPSLPGTPVALPGGWQAPPAGA